MYASLMNSQPSGDVTGKMNVVESIFHADSFESSYQTQSAMVKAEHDNCI